MYPSSRGLTRAPISVSRNASLRRDEHPKDLGRTGLVRLFQSGTDLYAVADGPRRRPTQETQRYLPRDGDVESGAPHGKTTFHKWWACPRTEGPTPTASLPRRP